jgi:hypothetical protein
LPDTGELETEPGSPFTTTLDAAARSVADRFERSDDIDTFTFAAELPVVLEFTGQRAIVQLEARDAMGAELSAMSGECRFSLEPSPCLYVDGTGPATVRVVLGESGQATQRELDAWRIGW